MRDREVDKGVEKDGVHKRDFQRRRASVPNAVLGIGNLERAAIDASEYGTGRADANEPKEVEDMLENFVSEVDGMDTFEKEV